MINLDNFSVVPPQLRMLIKFAPWILAGVLLVALMMTRSTLADVKKVELNNRVQLSQTLKVQPKWPLIQANVTATIRSLENYRTFARELDANTAAAKQRAELADQALKREQALNEKLRQRSDGTINRIAGSKPSGDEAKDRIQNAKDSTAPWSKWMQLGLNWSGADGYVMGPPQYRNFATKIQLITYPSTDAMVAEYASWARIDADKFKAKNYLRGFARYTSKGVCEIHIIDPEVRYQPHVLGHELAHCFYGAWHEDRVKL